MIYYFLYPVHNAVGAFRVFKYISFRTVMAMITALVIAFLLAPLLIRLLKKLQIGEKIREDGPQAHLEKSGTPTMGGLLIIASLVVSSALWMRLDIPFTWIAIVATLGFAAIGFLDDYLKLSRKNSKGLSIQGKLKIQFFLIFELVH